MEKKAVLKQSLVENGYTKFEMVYPGGKTFTKYLAPENINQDNDTRNEMCAWAEERGFSVVLDLDDVHFGE